MAFASDGRTLASAGDDGTVRLWDAATGAELRSLTGHTDAVNAVAFASVGRTLASAGRRRDRADVGRNGGAVFITVLVLLVALFGACIAWSNQARARRTAQCLLPGASRD